ncbi:ImmA/IrrE family metallo-endopeptidase [Pararhizobium qamdonense]|uniref:ImmA/IrrE family metallo-endopeptidase n=1 Tax=Pararhizobium qamdonense TaxID=3031126 RepID=UPI0023E18844|nr:ImmA/IrrE family metallo-endopeptidase [Pararhizobium qamdonense]
MTAVTKEWQKIKQADRETVAKHLNELPVKLGALAKDLGIDVKLSSLPLNVSGQIAKTPTGFEIKINRHESRQRQRFTLAHEIAHFLIHRDVIERMGGTLTDSVLYRSGASESIEYEANRLASQIVMPEHALRAAYSRFGENISESAVELLAEEFGVSKAAMEIRMAA